MPADQEADAPEVGVELRLEVLVDVAVEERVGACAGQPQQVTQHVHCHQRL